MTESLLMCSPEGFAVSYDINPWMTNQIGRVSSVLATSQWRSLFSKLSALADVQFMQGDPAWPDLVFTANAGLPLPWSKKIVLANFRHPQRQGEKPLNRHWFENAGWTCIELPPEAIFEGAGDALFDSKGRLWLGGGPRSSETTADHLRREIDAPIAQLRLVNPSFYHLDTCFCPLPTGQALYFPGAFDDSSQALLVEAFGKGLIALTPGEASLFCANAVCVGRTIVMNRSTSRLTRFLNQQGFKVVETPLTEFLKAGGGAKCLTLSLDGWVYEAARQTRLPA
jgi:N-dimethylarginine dimethylaminohydrolase